MADKQISQLTAAEVISDNDLFLIEQQQTAKKLTGQLLRETLQAYVDGHGGIQSITWETSGTSGDGQLHTGTIHYGDDTTDTFAIRDGYKGDTGDTWYTHIKYAGELPASDADMGDNPDNYIGIYTGTEEDPDELHWDDYDWFQWKGDKGNTGDACIISAQEVKYLASESGTVVPEGSWLDTIPTVASGSFLWCRTRITYNSGDIVTSYSVSRNGIDGQGAVSSVNNLSPDGNGNIALTASNVPTSDNDSVQTHLTADEAAITELQTYEIRHISGSVTSFPKSFSYNFITTDHRVLNCSFGTPSALLGDVSWTTSAGDVTFTGTLVSSGSTTIEFDIVKVVTP